MTYYTWTILVENFKKNLFQKYEKMDKREKEKRERLEEKIRAPCWLEVHDQLYLFIY